MRHWPKMGLVYLHYLYSNFYFFLNVFHSGSYFQPFSCRCYFPIPPENIRKSDIFCCFQGLENETSGMKWVNELFNCFFGYISGRILVGNKTKGRNVCCKKTKHAKFSKKTNISYPLIRDILM